MYIWCPNYPEWPSVYKTQSLILDALSTLLIIFNNKISQQFHHVTYLNEIDSLLVKA